MNEAGGERECPEAKKRGHKKASVNGGRGGKKTKVAKIPKLDLA